MLSMEQLFTLQRQSITHTVDRWTRDTSSDIFPYIQQILSLLAAQTIPVFCCTCGKYRVGVQVTILTHPDNYKCCVAEVVSSSS